MSFKICGTGSYIPKLIKTNDDLADIVQTSDEWIRPKTGIVKRHLLSDESLSDVTVKAAEAALLDSNLAAEDIDLIICATLQGDYITPSLACIVQERLGASCPAFDINAACSGFVYALDVAAGYFERGRAKNILVVCGEAMSRQVDWTDRSTCVLFGDGAGAVMLTKGDSLLSVRLTAEGNCAVMHVPSGKKNPFETSDAANSYLYMNGQEVFRFAVTSMKNDIEEVTKLAGLSLDDIAYVMPHQANLRIIGAAAQRLKMDREKILSNIDNYGNTSSASIAILLDESNKKGLLKRGDVIVFTAFGGGLTTGACAIRWDKD